MSNAIVLLSGGMDSTVALFHTLNQIDKAGWQDKVICLTFAYGQKHDAEIFAAKRVWRQAAKGFYSRLVGEHKIISVPVFPCTGSLLGSIPVRKYESGTIDTDAGIDPSFIPHRNLVFLSIAASWARDLNADRIITGLRGGFPDCTHKFELGLTWLLGESDPSHLITISAPTHCSRADTLRLAREIPGCWDALAYSMTCFEGTEPPCGKCLPCRKREQGFKELEFSDPLIDRIEANR